MDQTINTFVTVAPDCPATHSVVPVPGKTGKPVHVIQYELLTEHPYTFKLKELIFEVYVRHKGVPEEDRDRVYAEIMSKSHPCMRASALPKKYGWGVHYDTEGKIALYGMETPEYERFSAVQDGSMIVVPAMRTKRA